MIGLIKVGLFALVFALTAGCKPQIKEKTEPELFRMVVLPDRDPHLLIKRYSGLVEHLEKETGYKYQIIVPKDYADGLNMFTRGDVEMAFFGGYTFVKAHNLVKAVPLVSRKEDTKFNSVILVRSENLSQNLLDLKGARFSFGARLSTSGHLMPRRFMSEMGIIPEAFFSTVEYSGAHDKTAMWVVKGRVDAGVANAQIINNMFDDGRLNGEKVRILWRSPNYQDYVWAAQASIKKNILNDIRDAFLNLSTDNPDNRNILESMDASYFVPVGVNEFDLLIRSVDELNM